MIEINAFEDFTKNFDNTIHFSLTFTLFPYNAMKRDKDPDRREVMKKFTFKGVLDNFRTSVAQPSRADQEIQETLRPENFQVKRVSIKLFLCYRFMS